ncbi:bifunctional nuclease family protein [Corynebacterium uterequi]|uniref:BFN domain-containing protein n=1 Tax=Corynebacterium uterequi TaxID=1072256 RepID=A0A0G3HE78_9CORY|nr:bifunctional nuclease domain-containing protein [Corynebacterium uterequi]AKK11055.1 hypothetical protein CUTER_05290 [Corynebacterium uterequi]
MAEDKSAVRVLGVRQLGPERFPCVVLEWIGRGRVLPVWVSVVDAVEIASLVSGQAPDRPSTAQVLADVLTRLAGGVDELSILSNVDGLMVAQIRTGGGEALDARPSDVLKLAVLLDSEVLVDQEMLAEFSLSIPEEELAEYLDVSVEPPADAMAEGSADNADEELADMLRQLDERDMPGDEQ